MAVSCSGSKTTYKSLTFGFSADCPKGWTVSEDETSVCFQTPLESDTDDFYENVVYAGAVVLAETDAATLADFVSLVADGVGGSTTDFTEISRVESTVAGFDAVILTYTCSSSQTSYLLEQRMYLLSDGKKVYNIVYTANTDSFSRFEAGAGEIAESFSLTK